MAKINNNDGSTSEQDRERITAILSVLKEQYEERLQATTDEYRTAQHQLNRAGHEISRIERHLGRIDEFCTKNNVSLNVA